MWFSIHLHMFPDKSFYHHHYHLKTGVNVTSHASDRPGLAAWHANSLKWMEMWNESPGGQTFFTFYRKSLAKCKIFSNVLVFRATFLKTKPMMKRKKSSLCSQRGFLIFLSTSQAVIKGFSENPQVLGGCLREHFFLESTLNLQRLSEKPPQMFTHSWCPGERAWYLLRKMRFSTEITLFYLWEERLQSEMFA